MRIKDINYVPYSAARLQEKADDLTRYLRLSAEYGCEEEGGKIFTKFQKDLDNRLKEFEKLILVQEDVNEPDDLAAIKKLRPKGHRKMTENIGEDYKERLRGAFYGRMAGCTLGAALEFSPIETMESWAEYFGDEFPLKDYWSHIKDPMGVHYITGRNIDLTKGHMDAVPPDDDTIYTLLGLFTLEEYGMSFTHEDMAQIWKKYLPIQDDNGNKGCYWGKET